MEISPLLGRGYDLSPPLREVEVIDVTTEGAHLVASGLSTEVDEIILQHRAPSTRKLYALKWKLPSRPSQPPSWHMSVVPAGLFLRRVDPLHPRGSGGLSRPSWWPVSGQRPSSYTFPPRCTEADVSGQRSLC